MVRRALVKENDCPRHFCYTATCYVDTLECYLRKNDHQLIASLRKYCHSLHKYRCEGGGIRITLQNPKNAALRKLDRCFRFDGGVMHQAHIAYDFTMKTEVELTIFHKFLRQKLCPPYSRTTPSAYKGTHYIKGRRWNSVNIAIYADLPSRLTGEAFCVHTEIRITSLCQLRKNKITRPSHLLKYDYGALWQKYFRLADFKEENIQHAAELIVRQGKCPSGLQPRLVPFIRRIIACDDDGTPSAQGFRNFLNRTHLLPKRFLWSIPQVITQCIPTSDYTRINIAFSASLSVNKCDIS